MRLMKNTVWRAIVEIGFIIFLFYANLLMGEFERSGRGENMGFAWAARDILTGTNIAIGVGAAFIGYVVVELLRNKQPNEL